MHTFKGKSCTITYNGDYSGYCRIDQTASNTKEVQIRVDDLLEFAAEYIRQEKISKLEQAEWRDILLGL